MLRRVFLLGATAVAGTALLGRSRAAAVDAPAQPKTIDPVELTELEWRKRLDPLAFKVLREEGTERAHTSQLNHEERDGDYLCAGCGLLLFHSKWKYDSGTGWPSFYDAVEEHIGTKTDFKMILPRTEYHCARCGGHQGHIFDDGPEPTGLRYCNNGVALEFRPEQSA